VAHVVLPSVRLAQRAGLQAAQTLSTQKPLAGSFLHCPSDVHSTHLPLVAQVVFPSVLAVQRAVVHAEQTLPTQ
jgi:hypothetical protein